MSKLETLLHLNITEKPWLPAAGALPQLATA